MNATAFAPVLPRWDTGFPAGLEIVGMPLLERRTSQFRGVLDGVHVLYINHAISDALMVGRAMCTAGADVTSVLIPYHGGDGPTQRAIREGYAALGQSYQPPHVHPRQFTDVMRSAVHAAISHVGRQASLTGHRWMIVEDGGYAFPVLHDDPDLRPHLASCIGAVEHTTRGRWNYEYAEYDGTPATARTVERPAVTISGSALKTAHEGGFVAQALLDECHWLLRRDHEFLRHRTVAVVGYGKVGRALARALATVEARVLVVDSVVDNGVDWGMQRTALTEAIAAGAFLIFGATGTSSFSQEALTTFLHQAPNDTLYLASASSKAVEFAGLIELLEDAANGDGLPADIGGGGSTVCVDDDPDVGLRYHVRLANGAVKQLVVLANGYPVIFYPTETHGAPNRAMDPVMTQLFLASVGLSVAHQDLASRVHDVDSLRALEGPVPEAWHALIDEGGLLADWCKVNGLDWGAYQRAVGFVGGGPAHGRAGVVPS